MNSFNTKEIFIYKNKKLYGKMLDNKVFLLKNGDFVLDDSLKCELLDILPEGIDLQIMLRNFTAQKPIELLPFLKNTIGNFDFSTAPNKTKFDKPIMSNLRAQNTFPFVLENCLAIKENLLNPSVNFTLDKDTQRFSLSGYQHKLQASIINDLIVDGYGDFIFKPYNQNYSQLPENEHLNVSFMREFGFEVPFNGLVYHRTMSVYHYFIKRFDIDENGEKLPQISLNALMKSDDKYEGSIEKACEFLRDKLDKAQKMLFLRFIYANALLHNNDLHKKNIGFVFKDKQLVLSPIYDIINCFVIRGISDKQCALPIRGHDDGIRINYFKQSAENLGLDFDKVRENLQEIQSIFLEKYPQYVEKLFKIPNIKNILRFKEKLLESHKKCAKIAKSEANNEFEKANKNAKFAKIIKPSAAQEKIVDRFEIKTNKTSE